MKRVSGLLVLLAVIFLVSFPVAADGTPSSNEAFAPICEAKTLVEEEVTVFDGETRTALAVTPKPVSESFSVIMYAFPRPEITVSYEQSVLATEGGDGLVAPHT